MIPWNINQSNLEFPHSKTKPPTINRIKRSKLLIISIDSISILIVRSGYKITSSTSKIKKIKETMKNCSEKVWRLFSQGENPHSKGLSLFLSLNPFAIKNMAKKIITIERNKEKKKIILKI